MLEPEEWVKKLHNDLLTRNKHISLFWRYFDGEHPLGFATPAFREAFGTLFRAFASNWCPVVVNAKAERLHVDGFRLTDEGGSLLANQIWQANNLDGESLVNNIETLVSGVGHVLVWDHDGVEFPEITVESSSSCIVAHDPRRRSKRLAGLRLTIDAAGHYVAELFLPDTVHTYRSKSKVTDHNGMQRPEIQASDVAWQPFESGDGAPSVVDNPAGVVPLVPFHPKARARTHPSKMEAVQSELISVIPIQDAINKLICDMMVAAEYAAMPQRYATGFGAEYDVDGKPKSPIESWGQRLWSTESQEVSFGQFAVADLGNYIKGIETLVQHVASQSATPPHYFYLRGEFPSGESIRSAEASLNARVRNLHRPFGESWEEVQRIALRFAGYSGDTDSIETIWRDPEFKVESESADAAMKRLALGVPSEQLWEDLGYSPEQIRKFKRINDGNRMLDAALAAPSPAPAPPAAPAVQPPPVEPVAA